MPDPVESARQEALDDMLNDMRERIQASKMEQEDKTTRFRCLRLALLSAKKTEDVLLVGATLQKTLKSQV